MSDYKDLTRCDDSKRFDLRTVTQMADMVEVIRCSKCTHFERLSCTDGKCMNPNMDFVNTVDVDHFCADGERRTHHV